MYLCAVVPRAVSRELRLHVHALLVVHVEPIVTCDTCGYLLATMQDRAHNPLDAIGMVIICSYLT